ncbi:MAG: DUF1893 domain-containing protein [Chloroflexota bacterium]
MEDIELARSLLEEEKWNLVVVKGGRVLYSSRERGIEPFFGAIRSMGTSLHNAAAADSIMGSAVAMLCLYARITSVYAGIASQGALDMLKGQGVIISSKSTVPYISNYDGTDLCPFEKLAKSCQRPSQLFAALQPLFAEGDQ